MTYNRHLHQYLPHGMPFVFRIELPFASADFATGPYVGELGTRPGSVDREVRVAPADVFDLQVAAMVECIGLLDQREMSCEGAGGQGESRDDVGVEMHCGTLGELCVMLFNVLVGKW